MIYLFDWGDTLMRDDPDARGPMYLWENVSPCENAASMLEQLSKRHVIHIASNAGDSDESDIRKALDRAGIGKYIREIFCFKRLGVKKPSPEFFRAVLSVLSCSPSDIVMVGDHPESDAAWAIGNGASAVLYDPHGKYPGIKAEGFKIIKDLMELCEGES
jgi:putative hydrolase of the HAD superfamily